MQVIWRYTPWRSFYCYEDVIILTNRTSPWKCREGNPIEHIWISHLLGSLDSIGLFLNQVTIQKVEVCYSWSIQLSLILFNFVVPWMANTLWSSAAIRFYSHVITYSMYFMYTSASLFQDTRLLDLFYVWKECKWLTHYKQSYHLHHRSNFFLVLGETWRLASWLHKL